MPIFSKPHTEEWLQALEAFNPNQAATTKNIIELDGRNDICSICGGGPAIGYQLISDELEKDAVATLRLCNDCLVIRKTMYGENFDPLPS